jgi:hypothetical protein
VEKFMIIENKTAAPPTPDRASWKQKVFPKRAINRVGTTGQNRPAVIPQAQRRDAEPREDIVSTSSTDLPKEAVAYRPHFRIGSGINNNPFQLDPHSDWGINEESF